MKVLKNYYFQFFHQNDMIIKEQYQTEKFPYLN